MSKRRRAGAAVPWLKGVLMAGLVGWALSGCGSAGEDRSADADSALTEVDHIVSSQTVASQPGLPTNRAYTTQLIVEDGIDDAALSALVEATLGAAADILVPSGNAGVTLWYSDSAGLVDLRPAQSALDSAAGLNEVASDPRSGKLALSQDDT